MTQQIINYDEEMVGANHPAKADTINRALKVAHNIDGTHKEAGLWLGGIQGLGINDEGAPNVSFDSGHIDIAGVTYPCAGISSLSLLTMLGGDFTTADQWYFIYIDTDLLSAGAIVASSLLINTTAPVYDKTLGGWYAPGDTTRRCPIELGWCVYAKDTTTFIAFNVTGQVYNLVDDDILVCEDYSPTGDLTVASAGMPALGVKMLGHFWWLGQDSNDNNFSLHLTNGDNASTPNADTVYLKVGTGSPAQLQILTTLRTANAAGNIEYKGSSDDSAIIIRLVGFVLPRRGQGK